MLKKQLLPTSNNARNVLMITDGARKRRFAALEAVKIVNGESKANSKLVTVK